MGNKMTMHLQRQPNKFLFILTFLYAGLSCTNLMPPTATAGEVQSDQLERVVASAMKAWGVPGLAVAIVKDGQTVLLKGFGHKQIGHPSPVTPETLFPLASCTKAFTATLAGMLVDDGVIRWDDRVHSHLPAFRLSDEHADALVTLRDLLAHRTGVKGHDLLWYHAPWSIDETLARVEHLPLDYPFRGGFDYSSIMYMAAGRALAAAAGRKWEELVAERITTPLGMKSTYFTTPPDMHTIDRAFGHHRDAKGIIRRMPEYPLNEPNPAGSIHASIQDMATWLKFLLNDGVVNGQRLISRASLHETMTPQNLIRLEGMARLMCPDTQFLNYGLGWVVYDHRGYRLIAHGGVWDGFRAQITLIPQKQLGIALFNNLHESRINQAITNTFIDLFCGLPTKDWNAWFLQVEQEEAKEASKEFQARLKNRQLGTQPSLPLDGYANRYINKGYGEASVILQDGRLMLKWSRFSCPLEHWQDDSFRITEGFLKDQFVDFELMPSPQDHAAKKVRSMTFVGQTFLVTSESPATGR